MSFTAKIKSIATSANQQKARIAELAVSAVNLVAIGIECRKSPETGLPLAAAFFGGYIVGTVASDTANNYGKTNLDVVETGIRVGTVASLAARAYRTGVNYRAGMVVAADVVGDTAVAATEMVA